MDREDILHFIEQAKINEQTQLNLSNKDITNIPKEIGELEYLEHLDLSYNELETIPKELFNLTQLKTLRLFRNKLKNIPPQIGSLKNLLILDASYNNIMELPVEIGLLESLVTLDLSFNNIIKLPIEFINMLSIKELYLEKNNFVFPPEKVIKRGLYATMHYLTGEKRKRDAQKVIVQTYNMPANIQPFFRQYVEYFHDMIANASDADIAFEIKNIKENINIDFQLTNQIETYLINFLNFIKENRESLEMSQNETLQENLLDLQMVDLRNQISELNQTIGLKVQEIKIIQEKLERLSTLLERK